MWRPNFSVVDRFRRISTKVTDRLHMGVTARKESEMILIQLLPLYVGLFQKKRHLLQSQAHTRIWSIGHGMSTDTS